MPGYILPSNTDWVTCSWQCHRDRNPPSNMPGTDYGSAYGSPLYAVGGGTVSVAVNSTAGGNGRHVGIRLDDGRETWSLHLAEIWVSVGQRVSQGQQIGLTGASGFGSDWGYGAHVHQILWPGPAWGAQTIDFELYLGEDDDMPLNADTDYAAFSTMLQRALCFDTRPNGNGPTQAYGPTIWERLNVLETNVVAKVDEDEESTTDPCAAQAEATRSLTTPAWIAGFFLGLIGLVEVIQFVVDLVV